MSLADPDARPIRKGKPQHPTQFGYTALVAEDESGFVTDHQIHCRNPADAPQLVPAVERVTLVGRVPATVVTDRGFGTAANDQALADLHAPKWPVGVAEGHPASENSEVSAGGVSPGAGGRRVTAISGPSGL